jgi:hypothetical protein
MLVQVRAQLFQFHLLQALVDQPVSFITEQLNCSFTYFALAKKGNQVGVFALANQGNQALVLLSILLKKQAARESSS